MQLLKPFSELTVEALFNMCGNIISGQVSGETAKMLSERFPRILQDRESISINSNDSSISRSKQLEASITASTISTLSSGEFVGVTADDPEQAIELKAVHSKIINDHKALRKEKLSFEPLPFTIDPKEQEVISATYIQIKRDVYELAENVMEELLNDPEREWLVVRK